MINKHGVDLSDLKRFDTVIIDDHLVTVTGIKGNADSILEAKMAAINKYRGINADDARMSINEQPPFIKINGGDLWHRSDEVTALFPYCKPRAVLHDSHVFWWEVRPRKRMTEDEIAAINWENFGGELCMEKEWRRWKNGQ